MIIDKKIQIFLAAAEAESFSRAARKLSLSQSVVSFHMDSLEKELGVTLFRREGRSISLTLEGELLYKEAGRLAQDARNIENSLTTEKLKIAQRLYIAGDALTCAFTFPWTLSAFREKYPDVLFNYHHLDNDTLIEKLLNEELDLALSGYPIQHRKLSVLDCFSDEIALVSLPDKAPDSIKIDELRDLPLIWVTNDRGLEYTLERGLTDAGLPTKNLNIFMEVQDLPITKTFLRAGLGLAFLPILTVENEVKNGELKIVEVENLSLTRTNKLVFRKSKHQREIVSRFIEFVQKLHWEQTENQKASA